MNCAAELLDHMVAAGHGERPVIHTMIDGTKYSCTYRQLLGRANQIAHVLVRDLKLVPGNRVLLRGPNNPMMAACWFGVIKAGCIAVATMPLLRAKELKQVIDKARVGAALCDARLGEEMELAQRAVPRPEAGALVQRRAGPARSRRCSRASPPSSPTSIRRSTTSPDRLHLRHDRPAEGHPCTSTAT